MIGRKSFLVALVAIEHSHEPTISLTVETPGSYGGDEHTERLQIP